MVLHAPSVWERRSLPALIKAVERNLDGLFLFVGVVWSGHSCSLDVSYPSLFNKVKHRSVPL
jgi:hypothetical protein